MSTTELLVSYIKEMIKLQAELNMQTNGDRYISSEPRTTQGKFIYYPICLKMEACELLDSLPWKHWKYKENEYNYSNIKLELIDMLHFTLSLQIDHYARAYLPKAENPEDQVKLEDKTAAEYADGVCWLLDNRKKDNTNYAQILVDYIEENVNNKLENDYKNLNELGMEPVIGFMFYIDKVMQFTMFDGIQCIKGLYELIFTMYGLCIMAENKTDKPLKLEEFIKEIYNLYKAKLALNKLRQNYGYNAGTYKKEWKLENKLVEDNEYVVKKLITNRWYVDGVDFYKLIEIEYNKQLELEGPSLF